jgi:hypothetical protein
VYEVARKLLAVPAFQPRSDSLQSIIVELEKGTRMTPRWRRALFAVADGTQLPAAVLADLLGLHETTAAKWMHQAGGDWSRYAAQLAGDHPHQP